RFEPSEPPASAAIDEKQASEAPTLEDPNGADPVEPSPPTQDRQPEPSPPAVQLDAMLTDAKPPTKKKPAPTQKTKIAVQEATAEREVFMHNFYDFQDALQGFYEWYIGREKTIPSVWAQLTSLAMEEMESIVQTDDSRLRRILAKNMELLGPDDSWDEARRIFDENQLQLTSMRQVVTANSVERCITRLSPDFEPTKYVQLPSQDAIEVLLQSDKLETHVGFKIKFRRDEIGKLDELILEALQIIRIYDKVYEKRLKLVLVVFTTVADTQLSDYNDLFISQLKSIEPRAMEWIRFVAVNLLDQDYLPDRLATALEH
ncbi:MAG: hypothetical protein AAGA85_23225, partial [Bacteroidota bacterium]